MLAEGKMRKVGLICKCQALINKGGWPKEDHLETGKWIFTSQVPCQRKFSRLMLTTKKNSNPWKGGQWQPVDERDEDGIVCLDGPPST